MHIIRKNNHCIRVFLLFLSVLILNSCATPPQLVVNTENVCNIFQQYPQWYKANLRVARRWGVPIAVQMAIIKQESSFISDARPPRTKLLWVIPWKRPSTAFGYCQALDMTWQDYEKAKGGYWDRRNDYRDATDFMGWYIDEAHRQLGIPKNDAFRLYLIYHEGIHGYQTKTYKAKLWLINVAHRVSYQAKLYQAQLNQCYGGHRAHRPVAPTNLA